MLIARRPVAEALDRQGTPLVRQVVEALRVLRNSVLFFRGNGDEKLKWLRDKIQTQKRIHGSSQAAKRRALARLALGSSWLNLTSMFFSFLVIV